jgi:hypothetical protein
VKYAIAFAVGYLIADHVKTRREFRRLERFVLTSFMSRRDSISRNTRPFLWKADTASETVEGMSYKSMIMGDYEV